MMNNLAVDTTKQKKPDWRERDDVRAVIGQYLSERQYSIVIPLEILALYWLISAIIVLFMGIKVGLPLPVSWQASNASGNSGSVMSFPYFLVVVGALCVNRQFNAALAFGSTRRGFWLGTILGFLVTSTTTGLFAIVGLLVERATNHWWLGVHAFDVAVLGSGNSVLVFLVIAVVSMTSLLVGATYGTVFRSYGAAAMTWSILGTVMVLLAGIAVGIWQSEAVSRYIAQWGCWILVVGLAIVSLALVFVGYLVNRRATI